jgi:hypothetical protein
MKHVFVATRDSNNEILAVSRKRKDLRTAIENDWHRTRVDRLVWRKGDWSPWRYMGDRLVPARYTIEKHGVL